MTKYLKLAMVALFATMTFALTSCGDDDDDDVPATGGRGSISINGVKYNVNNYMTTDGEWDSDSNEGTFGFFIDIVEGKTTTPWPYYFYFVSNSAPKVGDDMAKKKLTLSLLTDYFTDLFNIKAKYVSGSAIVKNIDKSNETITITFSNLKMDGYGLGDGIDEEKASYTFDGTVTMDFRF